jgi:hypothetical protein
VEQAGQSTVTFRPGDDRINRDGRPVDLAGLLGRMAQDAERAERAIEGHKRRVIAALLLGQEPPPLPDDYPTEAERLAVDVRHLKGAIEVLKRRLDGLALPPRPQPARKRSKRRAAQEEADARALEVAEAVLARLQRDEETRLLSAGAALDRATPEDTTN